MKVKDNRMAVKDWSTTAASNDAADADINWLN